MAYQDLTAEQQGVVAEYTRLLRAWCGEQARTNNHGDALNSDYAQVQAILAELQDADVITDGSGLAGAGQGHSQGADNSSSREVVMVKSIGYPRPKRVSYPK